MRLILTLSLLSLGAAGQDPTSTSFVDEWRARAEALAAQGKSEAALAAVARALDRDANDLASLRLQATLAAARNDHDLAVVALHRWLELARRVKPTPFAAIGEVEKQLGGLDPDAKTWTSLVSTYVRQLGTVAKEQEKRKDPIAALQVYRRILTLDADNAAATRAVAALCRTLDRAPETVLPRSDGTAHLSLAWRAEQDGKHRDWSKAFADKTSEFTVRTDAGFDTLTLAMATLTAARAACRTFFPALAEGTTLPKLEARVFKSRDEYLRLGQKPPPTSASQVVGDAVETWVDDARSEREMRHALGAAVAQQFAALTLPAAPEWLRQGCIAMFAEADLDHDGRLLWQQANWPLLRGMAQRLPPSKAKAPDQEGHEQEGAAKTEPAAATAAPTAAPTARALVAGAYTFDPSWLAPAWSFVAFLYDHRDANGRLVYRDGLRAWMRTLGANAAAAGDPCEAFERLVLAVPQSPIKSLDALTPVWHRDVRARFEQAVAATMTPTEGAALADALLKNGARADALVWLQQESRARPDDAATLLKLAKLQESLDLRDDAVDCYRAVCRVLALRDESEDKAYGAALARLQALDPVLGADKVHGKLADDGLALVQRYRAADMPRRALEVARRLSNDFVVAEALPLVRQLAAGHSAALPAWRLVYDERSLGEFEASASYRAEGEHIVATLAGDLPPPRPTGINLKAAASAPFTPKFATTLLLLDSRSRGDFSLEAEMRVAADGNGGYLGTRMGLCFGVKDDDDFHAVLLQPTDVLDVVTRRGGTFTAHEHRPWTVDNHWLRLRIDVIGTQLDVFCDGAHVHTLQMPSLAALDGRVGLVSGTGRTLFRSVRYAARRNDDAGDVIERLLAHKTRAIGNGVRQVESFVGIEPPVLQARAWVQGGEVRLGDLRGRPVVLAFWSAEQDRAIPCTRLFNSLVERGKDKNLALVVFCDGGSDEEKVKSYLVSHPMPAAHIGVDDGNLTLGSYGIKGLPLILLLAPDGRAVFQGSANLELTNGWNGSLTPLEDPLRALLQ